MLGIDVGFGKEINMFDFGLKETEKDKKDDLFV